MKIKKIFYYTLFILSIAFCIVFCLSSVSQAGYPKLVNKIVSAFENIKDYIIAIATPIAAVAIRLRFSYAKI